MFVMGRCTRRGSLILIGTLDTIMANHSSHVFFPEHADGNLANELFLFVLLAHC